MSSECQITELLLRWDELREQGQNVTAEELCRECPEQAAEVARRIEALRAVYRALETDSVPGCGKDTGHEGAGTAGGRASDWPVIPEYEILGELGRGGMGIVYRARHIQLNRLVALKMILAGGHAGPADLSRFRAEAEAVARLQHPHIVQIHEVGDAEGRPFFSLEFVEGGSLANKLDGTPLPARQAAELVDLLARAMHAAHQKGVVHRDLKPANVLLTADGIPKVTDFGLAKRFDSEPSEPSEPRALARGVAPAPQTQTGAILGTPSYMAPEQASGKAKEVGPAADIYALGAILYELLTGRPPFRGETPLETVRQVVSEEPVPPSRLNPKAPRDLETIGLKCLEKDPTRRYATAAELADDLRRFLHGEPIQARPVGRAERLWRWCRRNPVPASLTAALAVVVAGALAGLTGLWLHAEDQREEALRQQGRAEASQRTAVANLDRAESNLMLAMKAVDDCFGVARDHPLLQEEHLRQVRKLLLEKALPFYLNFREQRRGDPVVEAALVENHFRVGFISMEIARPSEAIRSYQKAQAIQRQRVAAHPEDTAALTLLGRIHNNLGQLQSKTGDREAARKSHEMALAIRAKLAAAHPQVEEFQRLLAVTYNNLGLLEMNAGQREVALQSFDKARVIREKLAGANPRNPEYQSLLARTYGNLGNLQKDPKKREASLHQARALMEKLTAAHPGVASYRNDLAVLYANLAVLQNALRRPAAALRYTEKARAVQEKLADAFPEVTRYQRDLAITLDNLGSLWGMAGKEQAALESFEKAGTMREKLVARYPEVIAYRSGLANTNNNLGHLQNNMGQTGPARRSLDSARVILEKFVADSPEDIPHRLLLGTTYLGLAKVETATGNPQASRAWLTRAVFRLQEVRRLQPNLARARLVLSIVHSTRAETLGKLHRYAEAVRDWEEAIALDAGPSRARLRRMRADALARAGDHTRARSEADALAKDWLLPADAVYDLACICSLAAAAARQDVRLSSADREHQANRHAARAVKLLVRARAGGYFQTASALQDMKKDKDLDPLRGRADFEKFLAELEKKPAAKSK